MTLQRHPDEGFQRTLTDTPHVGRTADRAAIRGRLRRDWQVGGLGKARRSRFPATKPSRSARQPSTTGVALDKNAPRTCEP